MRAARERDGDDAEEKENRRVAERVVPERVRTAGVRVRRGGAGNGGNWWSSSPDGSNAWARFLLNFENVIRSNIFQRSGFSVRCVRDAE